MAIVVRLFFEPKTSNEICRLENYCDNKEAFSKKNHDSLRAEAKLAIANGDVPGYNKNGYMDERAVT